MDDVSCYNSPEAFPTHAISFGRVVSRTYASFYCCRCGRDLDRSCVYGSGFVWGRLCRMVVLCGGICPACGSALRTGFCCWRICPRTCDIIGFFALLCCCGYGCCRTFPDMEFGPVGASRCGFDGGQSVYDAFCYCAYVRAMTADVTRRSVGVRVRSCRSSR